MFTRPLLVEFGVIIVFAFHLVRNENNPHFSRIQLSERRLKQLSAPMDMVHALNKLMYAYHKTNNILNQTVINNTLHDSILTHLREVESKLCQLEIKARNLRQLKYGLKKDMNSLIYHYLMPAQSDDDFTKLDVFNIPDHCTEDPIVIMCNIGKVIGYPVTEKLIRGTYRDSIRRKNNDSPLQGQTIVVEFFTVKTKRDLIRAYRKHITILIDANTEERMKIGKRVNHIQVKHVLSKSGMMGLCPKELTKFMFIDDHLGPFLRRLFMQVEKHCKKVSIPYVWVNNSKIYVRRRKYDPAIRIKKFSNLLEIKSLANKYARRRRIVREHKAISTIDYKKVRDS
ncbi:hypothetical protein WDU94_011701 [Cyamophila willieti]